MVSCAWTCRCRCRTLQCSALQCVANTQHSMNTRQTGVDTAQRLKTQDGPEVAVGDATPNHTLRHPCTQPTTGNGRCSSAWTASRAAPRPLIAAPAAAAVMHSHLFAPLGRPPASLACQLDACEGLGPVQGLVLHLGADHVVPGHALQRVPYHLQAVQRRRRYKGAGDTKAQAVQKRRQHAQEKGEIGGSCGDRHTGVAVKL